tara:strand:- start:4217 stop:4471 length:255 start_codon:yes stop_codon:yes gene_type:complete
MKTTYKMKEATNKEEAIVSILDVIEENPLWLNKVDDIELILLMRLSKQTRRNHIAIFTNGEVIDLFVKLKKEYYHFKDFTQWNY